MENIRYKINAPSVVSEVIDGEAVIVNMDNGNYYSIDDSGAFIWDLLCQGANSDDLVGLVEKSYASSDVDVRAIISEIIGEFLKEELLVKAEDGAGESSRDFKAGSFDHSFSVPLLKKYTDMEELLLLDPIHEEDSSGKGVSA